jgi:serine-type D-Ala-D-Ala carboxypeptidase/endopeptidase
MCPVPGLAHEYSNYGYALLASVVSAAAGIRYQDYVRREVLEPLGMKSSGFAVSAVSPLAPRARLSLRRGRPARGAGAR